MKTGKYKVRKILNYPHDKEMKYASVDIYYEDESGSEFICDCGDWGNQTARHNANFIASILNAAMLLRDEL